MRSWQAWLINALRVEAPPAFNTNEGMVRCALGDFICSILAERDRTALKTAREPSNKECAVVEAADFGIPFCPDCHATMVKTRVQNEEGDWARHWLCECKVGPPEDMFVLEDHPQVAEEKHSPERRL